MQLRNPKPVSPAVIAVLLACVTAVVGLPAVATAAPASEAKAVDARWQTRRRDLAIGVGVAAAVTVAGMITTVVPASRCVRGVACSGDEFPRDALIAGPTVFVLGSLVTAGVGAALVHHHRWDRPGMKANASRPTHAAQRRLEAGVGLGVSLGGVATGSLTLGITAAANTNCFEGCEHAALGAGTGLALIVGGLVGLTVSATSYALLRRHRHDGEGLRVKLQPTGGGLRLHF